MENALAVEFEMPGEGYAFDDVTSLFLQAGTGMSRFCL